MWVLVVPKGFLPWTGVGYACAYGVYSSNWCKFCLHLFFQLVWVALVPIGSADVPGEGFLRVGCSSSNWCTWCCWSCRGYLQRGRAVALLGVGSWVDLIGYCVQWVAVVVEQVARRTLTCWLTVGTEMWGRRTGNVLWGLGSRDWGLFKPLIVCSWVWTSQGKCFGHPASRKMLRG